MFNLLNQKVKVDYVKDYDARNALIREVIRQLEADWQEQYNKITESEEYKNFIDNYMKKDEKCKNLIAYAEALEKVHEEFKDTHKGYWELGQTNGESSSARDYAEMAAREARNKEMPLPSFDRWQLQSRAEDLIILSEGDNAEEIIKELVQKLS